MAVPMYVPRGAVGGMNVKFYVSSHDEINFAHYEPLGFPWCFFCVDRPPYAWRLGVIILAEFVTS